MNKEFCLSDKKADCIFGQAERCGMYTKADVKEFIKRLKRDIPNHFMHSQGYFIHEIIDELAGDKLIGEKE